jgi:hypothetical protein
VSALLTVKINYISEFIQLKDIIQDFVLQEQKENQSSVFYSVEQDDCIITIFFIYKSMEKALAQDIHMVDFLSQIREMWKNIEMEFHKVIIDENFRQHIPIYPETQIAPPTDVPT